MDREPAGLPEHPVQPLAVLYVNRRLTDRDVDYLDLMLTVMICEWRKGEGRAARMKVIEEPA